MRILMHLRDDWREHRGGDVEQGQRWTAWLRALGIAVDVADESPPRLDGYDLLHVHNLQRAAALWPTVEHARRRGTPVVLTTLFWPDDDYERWGRPGLLARAYGRLPKPLRERAKSAGRILRHPRSIKLYLRELRDGVRGLQRRVLAAVDRVVVMSETEALALAETFDCIPPASVAPSGAAALYWSDDPKLWRIEEGEDVAPQKVEIDLKPRDGVLCVGRMDPQKGQHRLIQALAPTRIPLTLVGPENPNYPGYRAWCAGIASPSVRLLPPQPSWRLKELYRRARVHAQCSWYELSSLSALEAAACGTGIVTTTRGSMHEYFGDLAEYAEPGDPAAIRAAVVRALDAPRGEALASLVRSRYTWSMSAEKLLAAYRATLETRSLGRRAA
jgi:glycosyltransferase involved in cell wall biosynthesis